MLQPKTELRQDITGLRAVAVLAVTLYHIAHVLAPDNTFFKGGFLGVDIFFVISGFLMTKIIMTGLDIGNFSLYTFYKRRAKRICPALLATVVIFVSLAILIFDANYLVRTCRDGLRALGFISNFWFARKTGYFDGEASEHVFLHTWSLSVEWQFYLIYPLLLMLAYKLVSRKVLGILIVSLTVASLIFGCAYTLYNPVNSYFLLPSRAYELLFGALAYLYPLSYFVKTFRKNNSDKDVDQFGEQISKLFEIIGLVCIVASLVIVDSSSGWPNAWSILPILGTYLCIAADNKHTVLRNVVFQKLGLWSYAIYLVHWPLIVFVGYFSKQVVVWELLPIILIVGIILHYCIERRRHFGLVFLVVYLSITGGIVWMIKTDASVFRVDNPIEYPTADDVANNGKAYSVGDASLPVDFILVGDSYSRQYLGVVGDKALHIVAIGKDACISTPNFYKLIGAGVKSQTDLEQCKNSYIGLLDTIKQNPSVPVVWAQSWNWYSNNRNKKHFYDRSDNLVEMDIYSLLRQELALIVKDLSLFNNRLYILGKPRVGDDDTDVNLGKKCYPLMSTNNDFSSFLLQYLGCREIVSLDEPPINVDIKSIIKTFPLNQGKEDAFWPVTYIEPADAYCNKQNCRIMNRDTYEPYFFDGSHTSKYGAELILRLIVEQVKEKEALYHLGAK